MATNDTYIEAGLDIGTGTTSVNGAYRISGKRVIEPDIHFIQGMRAIPTVVAYYGQPQKFYCGEELMRSVKRGEIPASKVIRLPKMVFYEGFDVPGSSDDRDKAIAQLAEAGVSPEEMLADLFAYIMGALRHRMCQTQLGQGYTEGIKAAPIKLRCTLPQSFGPESARKYKMAAEKAGISNFVPISEQLSALVAYLDNWREGPSPFSEGDAFIFIDAGCGTVDCVLYRHQGGEGGNDLFAAIAQSYGSVFGSQRVNFLMKRTVLARLGGLESIYKRLKMESADVDFQLEQTIEYAKKNFDHSIPGDYALAQVHIANYALGPEDRETINFSIIQQTARDALDIVIDENFKEVDDLLQKHKEITEKAIADAKASKHLDRVRELEKKRDLGHIVLSGGGAQCLYMREKYQEKYKKQYGERGIAILSVAEQMNGEALHVAKGTLSPRYSEIDTQQLPLRYTYVVLRDEIFDWHKHPDAWEWGPKGRYGKRQSNGQKAIARQRRVIPSKASRLDPSAPLGTRTVLLRMLPIIRKGQSPKDRIIVGHEFQPFVDDLVVTLSYACTELDNVKDHAAALADDHNVSNRHNKLRQGVIPWAEGSWTLDKHVMGNGLWEEAIDYKTGRAYYKGVLVKSIMVLKEEKDMTVKLELVIPNKTNGVSYWDGPTIKVHGVFKLWNGDMCEFVSDADAGNRPVVGKGGAGGLETEAGVAADLGDDVDGDGDSRMD